MAIAALGVAAPAAAKPAPVAAKQAPAAAKQAPAVAKQAPGSVASGEDAQSGAARAAMLFKKGNDHYIEERWAEAEAAYREAWEIRKAYDVAAHLGHTEFHLRKYRDAATHLSYALQNWPTTANAPQREAARERLAEVRQKVGALKLQVSAAGAEVSVDGRSMGMTPIAHEIFVDPGAHTVVATLKGYETASRRVVVQKGDTSDVELPLRPIRLVARQEEEAPSKSKPLLIAGAGLSLALVGTGAGFLIMAQGRKSDFESVPDASSSSECVSDYPSRRTAICDDLKDALSDNQTYFDIGLPLSIVGGAVGVATLVYTVWPSSKPEPRGGGLRVQPVVSAKGQGVWVTGQF